MATLSSPIVLSEETFADVVERLGGVPLDRIRIVPAPGTATEQDVLEVLARTDRLCELVDGVLSGFQLSLRDLFAEMDASSGSR
jgi:hypothetical protein